MRANHVGRGHVAKQSGGSLSGYVSKEKRTGEFRLERMNGLHGITAQNGGDDDGEGVGENIRRGGLEIAFVMAYFKMGIDVAVIRASVYANLVRQARAGAKELSRMKKS